MKEIIRQTWNGMKVHPLLSVLTIVGTAVSIALIMIIVMSKEALSADYGNEPNRSRSLYIDSVCDNDDAYNQGYVPLGLMAIEAICGQPSELIEHVAIVPEYSYNEVNVIVGMKSPVKANAKSVNDDFFNVFRFHFLAGRPFTPEEHTGCQPLVIINEHLARQLFGSVEAAMDKDINVTKKKFRVTGVVSNVSHLMTDAYADLWLPANYSRKGNVANPHLWGTGVGSFFDDISGMARVILVARHKSDLPQLKEEVNRRFRVMADMLKQDTDWQSREHDFSFDLDRLRLFFVGTHKEDMAENNPYSDIIYLIIFSVLLIVPAINLTSMTQSRMRQRRAEIGIRRAFGAKRSDILCQVFLESLMVTLVGGILGLLIAICLIALNGTQAMIAFDQTMGMSSSTMVDMSLLFDPWVYLWALAFSFLLNLLSSMLPAWRASRTDIVKSLK